jgi:hypothetical protein
MQETIEKMRTKVEKSYRPYIPPEPINSHTVLPMSATKLWHSM